DDEVVGAAEVQRRPDERVDAAELLQPDQPEAGRLDRAGRGDGVGRRQPVEEPAPEPDAPGQCVTHPPDDAVRPRPSAPGVARQAASPRVTSPASYASTT